MCSSPRHTATAGIARIVSLVILLLATTSCLFPATIVEEEPEEDLPPFFDELNVEPLIGEVVVSLDRGFESFIISSVVDPNLSQILYWRALVNYNTLGIANLPVEVPASQRNTVGIFQFQYGPCVPQHLPYAVAQQAAPAALYLAISDAPFVDSEQAFDQPPGERVKQAFKTNPPGRAVIAQWFLSFEGDCPLR